MKTIMSLTTASVLAISAGTAFAEGSITAVSWGGAYQKGQSLGIFQPAGNSATISSGIPRLCVSDDDVPDEPDHWCRGLDCSWAISIHTCEGIVSTTLSEPNEISCRETSTRF